MDPIDELKKVLTLLQAEQDADRIEYTEKVLKSPERRAMGVTWYPIVIRESYYGMGERLILEVERTSFIESPNLFQSGKVAALFSNAPGADREKDMIAGVVTAVRPNNIKLTLFVDELPDWVDDGKLGVDILFDENSYKEMQAAMERVMKAKNNRLADLRDLLLGEKVPSFGDQQVVPSALLNDSQNRAVLNVVYAEDVAVIHGPPGTGKTTTLIEAIMQTLNEEEQVLVCAPSNTAVDLLTERLAEKMVNVVRLGHPSRVTESLLMHTLDYQISNHKDYKQIKELKKRSVEFRNFALKYKRNFGKEERAQRKMVLDESRKLQQEAHAIESYITEDIISKAQVFTCTLVGAASHYIKERNFRTVFIDEAAQALEPASWIPIQKAERVIFAGDHCQLPPTVKSAEAMKGGLAETLFEKVVGRKEVDVMLEVQYRSNEQIMNFSSGVFYKGKLHADESVKNSVIDSEDILLATPVEYIDTAGTGYEEKVEKETLSTYNPEEADLLIRHLKTLRGALEIKGIAPTCGIISPYKAQVNLIKEKLAEFIEDPVALKKISVNTVDGFQGQERDIIYISMVRSNSDGEIGFLSDVRRMNVALTRARKKLVVIGDSGTLSNHKFYRDFLDYIDKIGAYKTAWEYIG
ncbi:MAG: AAA domain-containing protein [Cytophagaceae bacterium]